VPKVIGEWRVLEQESAQIVDPGQQELLSKIYSQILTRTYISKKGELIMLSIAYGKDQRDGLQLHQPEVCYPAQGFQVHNKEIVSLQLLPGSPVIPITRLETVLGNRHEPVTYWTTVGEHAYSGVIDKKMAEIRYGLAGKIPDGMLVRISSIDIKPRNAYEIQIRFARDMVANLPEQYKPRFVGRETFAQ
jgi:EpsI family protein